MAALASVASQIEPGDEVLVVCNDRGDQGDWARNTAIERARGTHLIFLDDDDEYVRGAFEAMRRFASDNPGRIGIFQMQLWNGAVLWTEPVLRYGNVGSPMFVVPNVPGRLGRWDQSRRANDWAFIEETAALQGEPVFCPTIVARIRSSGPFSSRWEQLKFRMRLRTRGRRLASRIARPGPAKNAQ